MPEGRGFVIEVSPGVVAFRAWNMRGHEESASFNPRPGGLMLAEHGNVCAHALAAGLPSGCERCARRAHVCTEDPCPHFPEPLPTRIVADWSGRSRSRFHRKIASLDWAPFFALPGSPVMVTLTYPGDWLTVAPSGKACKKHLEALKMRWHRRWGLKVCGMWKMEFQRRGAPHFHLFLMRPSTDPKTGHPLSATAFAEWLSATWAGIVAHPDPEQRAAHLAAGTGVDTQRGGDCRDPRRLAVYFGKHGSKTKDSKEYQHNVPREWLADEDGVADATAGPGRFWGYWGLSDATGGMHIDQADYMVGRRIVRRWMEARTRYLGRKSYRTLGVGGGICGGWVMVNDGPAFASQLARAIDIARSPRA